MFELVRTKRFFAVLVVALMVFAGYSLFGDRGLVELSRLYRHRIDLRDQVRRLEVENARLAEEIGLLREDAETIEHLARTRLDMVRPGEVVYIFPDGDEGSTP